MTSFRKIATLLGAVAMAACSKDSVQNISAPISGAYVRFFNFGVNAPSVNFYADAQKVTAVVSTTGTEATTGVGYGGAGAGGFYTAVTPGQHSFMPKIAATTDKDLAIATLPATVVDGKFYSMYTGGFYNTTTKSVDFFLVEDPLSADIDFANATVRFVNAIGNTTPVTLYLINTTTGVETAIGGATGYKGVTAFVTLPAGIYDMHTRTAGSSTKLMERLAVTLASKRTYTISALGDFTVGGTTATNRARLDVTANR